MFKINTGHIYVVFITSVTTNLIVIYVYVRDAQCFETFSTFQRYENEKWNENIFLYYQPTE